jgi:hypothetical protein
LAISIALETGSLLGCLREIAKLRRGRGFGEGLKRTRNAELVVVLGEDIAALLGLVIAFIFVSLAAVTGDTRFDALGSISIGVVLIAISVFVAVRIKRLIVGASAEQDLRTAIDAFIRQDPAIERVFNAITQQVGSKVMLAAKIKLRPAQHREAVAAINALERRIARFRKSAGASEPDVEDDPRRAPAHRGHGLDAASVTADVDDGQHAIAGDKAAQILARDQPVALAADVRIGRDVRRDEHVWRVPQRVIRRERLGIRHVEARSAETLVSAFTSSAVTTVPPRPTLMKGARFHRGEHLRVEKSDCLISERQRIDDDVRSSRQRHQLRGRANLAHEVGCRTIAGARGDDPHVKAMGTPCDLGADAAEPGDQHRLALQRQGGRVASRLRVPSALILLPQVRG